MNPLSAPIRMAWSLAVAFALLAGVPAAQACTASETGGTLTAATSLRVNTSAPITGSGTFNFTCGASVLSALAGTPTLKATLQASVSGLTLKNGGFSIPYQLYSNAGNTTAYTGSFIAVNLNGSSLLGLLNGAGGSVPIYIATTPSLNVPAGTYTDTVQLTWTYQNICEGAVNVGGLCLGTLNNGTATRSLTISLTVNNDCTITAPQVNFGTAPLVASFGTVSQNISLLCTKNMTYTVGLSAGGYASGGRRQMASGANRLAYDIFKADNSVWGSVGTARANGPAVADGATTQTIPYTARVYTDQATPAAGTYADTVVVDVSF